jgi:L-ascorbate metabolism protein UlaG (beta-lactamase superfamily)
VTIGIPYTHTLLKPSLAAALAAAIACTGPRAALRPEIARGPERLCEMKSACSDTVSVTHLGVDGFVVRYRSSAVLTPPLFSRRGILSTALGFTFRTDTAAVDAALLSMGVRLDDVSTVVVGHSHYDHLMDVPYIARKYLPQRAQIVGTPSMKHILAADSVARGMSVEILRDDIGSSAGSGRWIYAADGRSRVMAFASAHPANVGIFTFAPGRVLSDRTKLPRSAWGWKLGETYAYLIDFIRPDSTPVFRVFYHDAPFIPSANMLTSLAPRDQHRVNIAIICAGNFRKLDDYPQAALAILRPDRVVVGHWDDFFHEWSADPHVLRMTKTRELAGRLDASVGDRWMTPMPGSVFRFIF